MAIDSENSRIRFADFEADLTTGELFQLGHRVRIERKPFQILELLLRAAGDLVSRTEIYDFVWPGVHVDRQRCLNVAIGKLRAVLADQTTDPQMIETVGSRGYRLLAPVASVAIEKTHLLACQDLALAVLPFQNLRTFVFQQQTPASRANYLQIIEKARLPLCLLDKQGIVVHVNDGFMRAFGYLREEIPTMEHWWRLAYPDFGYRKQVIDMWNAMVSGVAEGKTDIQPVEYDVTCRDGKIRSIETVRYYVDDCFLTSFIDVTERKRSEEALLASEKLQARMALTLADRINNSLTAVMNTVYLARISADVPAPARQYLEMADDELKRISQITSEAPGFGSRLEVAILEKTTRR